MRPELDNYTLALAAEPYCIPSLSSPWYMTVLESIRKGSIKAVSTFVEHKHESLETIFWKYTTNCLRAGQDANTYVFTLISDPVFEIHLHTDDDLKLISADAQSDSLTEALPELIDVTKYVELLYQEFLVHLIARLAGAQLNR